MKRLLVFILILVFCFNIISCSKQSNDDFKQIDNNANTETNNKSDTATDTETEVESDTEIETEIEIELETDTNTEVVDSSTDTETELEPETNTETEVDSETNTDTDTETDTESDIKFESNAETDTATDTDSVAETDTSTEVVDTSTDTATETEIDVNSSTATETETEVDTETDTNAEVVDTSSDATTDTAADSDTNTETNTETDTVTDVTDSSTETATDIETEVDTSTETEVYSETDTATDTEADTETEVDTETDDEQNNSNSDIASLSVAEKRNRKVVLQFQDHLEIMYIEFCIEKNEDGNQYVAYAPNYYNYYVLVECVETTDDVWNRVNILRNQYESGIKIDAVILPDNVVMIVFPDFNSYYSCQEELLNDLSEYNSTERIIVDFFNAQNETKIIENSYEYIKVQGDFIFDEDAFIQNYEEFTTNLSSWIEHNTELQKITEKTFEENYVFVIKDNHYDKVEISDAVLVGDTLYFTRNLYNDGKLHDTILHQNSYITIVPKADVGELNQQIKIKTVYIYIFFVSK